MRGDTASRFGGQEEVHKMSELGLGMAHEMEVRGRRESWRLERTFNYICDPKMKEGERD